ncbi:hypothetical protein G3I60_05145 [Streptomyces sp. SID13666]|uniref:hypothetical protein n=1 Tax=Streptomyces sp. SID13666 TaxID=2706054 RepID=UPI0013BFDDE6|nr:hypothetical protein [Streptomyces sp. SID13666]
MDFKRVCRTALETKGVLGEPWLAEAFDVVDRKEFTPDRIWTLDTNDDGLHSLVDRNKDHQRWARAVYDSRRAVITQMDDGAVTPDGPAAGSFTSTISALDIVFEKLGHLELDQGHRVWELGTGSGYNTALLCERVGSALITSVEVDAALTTTAQANLKAAGYEPNVTCGNGELGDAQTAPHDRMISTASLLRIPGDWVQQCAQDAIILTPFGTAYDNSGLLKLRVRDGIAEGNFVGNASYMWIRQQRPSRTIGELGDPRTAASVVDPYDVMQGPWQQDFAIGLRTQDLDYAHSGQGEEKQLHVWDLAGTSSATITYRNWWEDRAVTARGPRDLWGEIVSAFTWYRVAGSPDIRHFGLTVSPAGQAVWLHTPDNIIA